MTDATDIPGLLSDLGITLRRQKPGAWVRTDCPRCHGGREKEQSLAVKIDDDHKGLLYKCHRGTCGWEGSERLKGAGRSDGAGPGIQPRHERVVAPPPAHPPTLVTNKPPALYRFFEQRGISADTVDWFGCYIARRWFPAHSDLEAGEHPAIVWPYLFNNQTVNRKYRSARKLFMQEKDALPALFNIDAVTSDDIVYWCEGEADVMAMHEAGYRQIVTLPNGAGNKLRDEDDPRREDDERFAPLRTHADLLGRVKKFVIAGDMDEPGMVLREELARRLGRHRCWIVTWPKGCKDGGDVLREHGAEAVRDAVEAASPYPIEGVHYVKRGTLAAYRDERQPPLLTTGIYSVDRMMKIPSDGRLIVVTGIPGMGKSTVVRAIMVHTAMEHARRWAIYSPEMSPWRRFAATIAEVLVGSPFHPRDGKAAMAAHELEYAEAWMAPRFVFLAGDVDDKPPTIEWILETARVEVLRMGITDLLIDPWNQVAHDFGRQTETQYTERQLQILAGFGQRHGVNIWIVAHPAKLQPIKPGGVIPAPGLYDIAGSATWFNRPDLGITIHTPAGGNTEIHLRKARFSEYGERGQMATAEYEKWSGRYLTPAAEIYDQEGR